MVITAIPARLEVRAAGNVRPCPVDPDIPDHRSKTPPVSAADAAAAFYDPIVEGWGAPRS